MAAAARARDPFRPAFAQSTAIEAALSADPLAVGGLGTLAKEIGAPSLLARCAYHRGQQHLNTSPDPDPQALATTTPKVPLAQSVGDTFMARWTSTASSKRRLRSGRRGGSTRSRHVNPLLRHQELDRDLGAGTHSPNGLQSPGTSKQRLVIYRHLE